MCESCFLLDTLDKGTRLPSIEVQGKNLTLICPGCGKKRSIKDPLEAESAWRRVLIKSGLLFPEVDHHEEIDLSFRNIPTFG